MAKGIVEDVIEALRTKRRPSVCETCDPDVASDARELAEAYASGLLDGVPVGHCYRQLVAKHGDKVAFSRTAFHDYVTRGRGA